MEKDFNMPCILFFYLDTFFIHQLGTKTLVVHVDYYNNIKKEEILKVTI